MKTLTTILFLVLPLAFYAQAPDCKKFKNGKFKIIDSLVGNTIITRKGSTQIEYSERNGAKAKLKVKWIDDCTYTLQLIKMIYDPEKRPLMKDMILTVKITRTTNNSYIQITSSNLFEEVFEMEMIKMD